MIAGSKEQAESQYPTVVFNSGLPLILIMIFSLLGAPIARAQEDKLDTEVVNIVKPYTPSVSDAFKIRQTPRLLDSSNTRKKAVNYEIFSVPVASTFTPAKGTAADIEPPQREELYDNYASLGFGNYTGVLAEFFSNFELSRTDNAGLSFRHNSSQGGIDNVRLDNKFYDTRLEGNYYSRQKELGYGLKAGVSHQLFNWYGLSPVFSALPDPSLDQLDVQQQYTAVYAGGDLSMDRGIFRGGNIGLGFQTDRFGSSEFRLTARPELMVPIADLDLVVSGDLDLLNGSFDQDYRDQGDLAYGYFNAGVKPSLVLVNEDLTLSLGFAAYASLDMENSDNNLYLYPNVNASYRLMDELAVVYGGLDGGLRQNTYRGFSTDNPFVSPSLDIRPTSQAYDAFAGIKGKLSEMLAYNLRASYGREADKPLFRLNPVLSANPEAPYQYGNSFGLVYDDVNTLSIFGEFKLEISDGFDLGARASYYSYSLTDEDEAWNLPGIEAAVYSNFDITDEIYGGVNLFFTGTRNELFAGGGQGVGATFAEVRSVDAFVDANIELGYRLNPRLTFFVKGNNLVGGSYERWLNFPVLGVQALLGATYKFDW